MKKFYENGEKNPAMFNEQQRAHHKEMKELCDYLSSNLKTSPSRGSSNGHEFNLSKSYNFQQNLNKHNLDKFDAPKQVEKPKIATPKVVTPKVEAPKVETPKVETPKLEVPKVENPVIVPDLQPAKIEGANTAPELIRADSTEGSENPIPELPVIPETVKTDDRPKIEPFIGTLSDLPKPPNLFDFSGDGDSNIERPRTEPALPRSERPLTPYEYEREVTDPFNPKPTDKAEQKTADKLNQNEFDKVKEAFQYDAAQYRNALRQAARENKPLVLIAGTKNSSAEFLKSAAAQAKNDKAVYVFVDLDSANQDLPITQYLETSIAQRNQQTNQHDDNWTSVFRVSSDGRGGVVNHSPEYSNTGAKASNTDSIQKAIDDVSAKATDRARAYSNQGTAQGTVYNYQPNQPTTNYYNSSCRPRRGVLGFRR
jgi:hypothetical protein